MDIPPDFQAFVGSRFFNRMNALWKLVRRQIEWLPRQNGNELEKFFTVSGKILPQRFDSFKRLFQILFYIFVEYRGGWCRWWRWHNFIKLHFVLTKVNMILIHYCCLPTCLVRRRWFFFNKQTHAASNCAFRLAIRVIIRNDGKHFLD